MPVYQDVVCTFCGSLCDDIEVEVENNQISKVKRACTIGRNKLLHAKSDLATLRVGEREVSLETALEAAAEILGRAEAPLIYGLSSTTSEAQREAVALAESVGGIIDNPSSY